MTAPAKGLYLVHAACAGPIRGSWDVALLSTGSGCHHPFAMQMPGFSFQETPQGLFKNKWVGSVGSGGGEMLQIKATLMQRDRQLNVWQLRHSTGMDLSPLGVAHHHQRHFKLVFPLLC